MKPYYKATSAVAIALLVVSSVIGLALGQGGTGRTNTNSAKPAPKRTTPAKKPARSAGSKPRPTPAPAVSSESTESELWEAIRNSPDVQDYKDYLGAFPNGAHAVIARTRIRQLEAAKDTPAKPATPGATSSNMPRTNQTGIEFVLIPQGTFMMGSTNGGDNEKPAHRITINYSIYMGKYEVTQAQWQSVTGNNPSNFKDCGGNCPVEQVSWDDAQNFIRKLNQMNDGYTYRLPTEAEWEYACRAGTTTDYSGDQTLQRAIDKARSDLQKAAPVQDAKVTQQQKDRIDQMEKDYLNGIGWYSDNSGGRTHAVGQKQPNAWGLADMHGNVWEWCEDWYHETYIDAPTDGSARLSVGDLKERVLRGGSWHYDASFLRSPFRYSNKPESRHYYFSVGFRVVATARRLTRSISAQPVAYR